MSEACWFPPDSPAKIHKLRVARLAGRQSGLISRRQMLALGVPSSVVGDWIADAYLYRRLPGVYAVGHTAPSVQSRLTAALLWAGPGAMLSHACGAWWLGLTARRPPAIELCTPRQVTSRPGIVAHGRSALEPSWLRELPTAPIAELLRQLATTASDDHLRKALSEAEYQGWLELGQVRAVCGRGRPGSAKLQAALGHHLPQLAVTQNDFERRLIYLCERHGLPIPECNVHVEGFRVDALWRREKVIVELDGKDGHAPWSRIRRDRRRDVILRAAGFVALRYVWDLLKHEGDLVAADIARALSQAARSA